MRSEHRYWPSSSSVATISAGARSTKRGEASTLSTCSRSENGARWRCGERATRGFRERIGGRAVTCEKKDVDRYGRIVAVCRAGGEDLNAWMVERGWALAYRRYSRSYVDEEAAARSAHRCTGCARCASHGERERGRSLGEQCPRPVAGNRQAAVEVAFDDEGVACLASFSWFACVMESSAVSEAARCRKV